MPDFATALRARLIADSEVAAVTTKVHWGIVPQNTTLPYIRLNIISDPRPENLQGYDSTRLTRAQASCFASTYAAARQLALKVKNAVAVPAGNFGRIHAEGPVDEQGAESPAGYIHHARVDLRAEHNLD